MTLEGSTAGLILRRIATKDPTSSILTTLTTGRAAMHRTLLTLLALTFLFAVPPRTDAQEAWDLLVSNNKANSVTRFDAASGRSRGQRCQD